MTTEAGRISFAEWRPLGDTKDEPRIHPTVLIFHTMVGYLKGTETMFRTGDFDGLESTFGLGGPWDGEDLDGALWQWQDMRREADAQFAGNAYADSCECSDGGDPHRPYSSKQLKTAVKLVVEWCRKHDAPAQVIKHPKDKGIGWHELFPEWNENGHTCPGPVREGQIRTIILPKARAILDGKSEPKAPKPKNGGRDKIDVDGIIGADTVGALQHAIGVHVDGIWGPETRRALQHHLGVHVTGNMGPATITQLKARLKHLGYHIDRPSSNGWTHDDTRALQKALNDRKF